MEKITIVGTININADKKYIKTLIVLSKLNFFPKTENNANTKAPLKANISPCKLVKLNVVIFPLVVIMTIPKKLIKIPAIFFIVILSQSYL